MAQHGWGGRPPAGDEEARQRIVDAAAICIDRYGVAKTTLSDVATELQVTRQTVYRHFAKVSDIVGVVAEQGAAAFVDDLVAHLDGVADARRAVVDGFLFCLRAIPADPRLSLLLELGDEGAFGRRATAAPVLAYGAAMLRRYPVDWAAAGIADADLDGLAEVIMRLLISMLEDPDVATRSDDDVRALLERWVVPALD
ncbi:TetR/AcrR family transcriptional regulator [Nocardioides caeni]|uniref:TetR/AcrR family transcriptional regulator n=1 Tax=Nocardioides caeni TaxID=574700 RepID=A0A4S8MZ75_9ACTN|nr:TetR/AcrR family transcriptional regulator [Nocardioides caeni]THV08777.1 TetR/AcrR family transcriptional regulator [Nocardioides caeni]